MTTAKGLGLQLPEQKLPDRGSFNTKPKKVEEWVQALPMANVGETARRVYGALREVNRLQVAWQDRYRFLEALNEPLNHVATTLKRHFIGVDLPLPPKTQKIAALSQALYQEAALGYKAAIEDMLGGSFLFRDKAALTVLLHRAIHYQGRALLIDYQLYAPLKPSAWSELHRLYRYAEHKRLHQSPVTDEEHLLASKTTVSTAYKQILLLALASPYRLRQKEIECTYSALERWASEAMLLPTDSPQAAETVFVVDLDRDEAPTVAAYRSNPCTEDGCRLLQVERLARAVEHEMAQFQRGIRDEFFSTLGPAFSLDLLQRLAVAWGEPPEREFNRHRSDARVWVLAGLRNLHQNLSTLQGEDTAELTGRRSVFASRSVVAASQPEEDVWNKAYFQFDPGAGELDTKRPSDDEEVSSQPPTFHSWEVVNESAGGYCLSHQGQGSEGIQVGELLGLHDGRERQTAPWQVGTVRWMRRTDAARLEMGVQILAPRAAAAAVRAETADGTLGQYQRALVLPPIDPIGQPISLLVPTLLFKTEDRLFVHSRHGDGWFRLGKVLTATGSYTQFELLEDEPEKEQGPENEQDSEFSGLWSQL